MLRSLIGVSSTLATAFTLLAAPPVSAKERFVRIVWDVGEEELYYEESDVTSLGQTGWTLPEDGSKMKRFDVEKRLLRKGDRVTLYLVNYNSVAHVHENTTVTRIEPYRFPVGTALSAIALALTGTTALPTPETPILIKALDPSPLPSPEAQKARLNELGILIMRIRKDVEKLDRWVTDLANSEEARKIDLVLDVLESIPTREGIWSEFKNDMAWRTITGTLDSKIGGNSDQFFDSLEEKVKEVSDVAQKPALGFAAFDSLYAALVIDGLPQRAPASGESPEEKQERERENQEIQDTFKRLAEAKESLAAAYSTLWEVSSSEGHWVAELLAKSDRAVQIYKDYKRKVSGISWRADPVKVQIDDPMEADVLVRIDAAFKSAGEDEPRTIQKILTFRTRRHSPDYILSVGVGFNNLGFKSLAVVQTPEADDEGALMNELVIKDDTSYELATPTWLQSIRVPLGGDGISLYGTVGTTPDRNIFKNIILGVSPYYAPWRTLFTFGVIGAGGYQSEDLEPIRSEFTQNGFALPGVDPTLLPLSDEPWHWSFYFGMSFNLISN